MPFQAAIVRLLVFNRKFAVSSSLLLTTTQRGSKGYCTDYTLHTKFEVQTLKYNTILILPKRINFFYYRSWTKRIIYILGEGAVLGVQSGVLTPDLVKRIIGGRLSVSLSVSMSVSKC